MTHTPDEIKKGLECCMDHDGTCEDCPYVDGECRAFEQLAGDALALIQQLEADKQQLEGMLTHMNQLRDAAAGRALSMEERVHQLEAERDAAVRDMYAECACDVCKHNDRTETICSRSIEVDNCFEWRGVQKEGTK